MAGKTDAAAVVLYEALRQRRRDVAPPGTQTPRPPQAESAERLETDETDDLAETPELEDQLTEAEPVDDLVAEDGETEAPAEIAKVAKAPRKTAARTLIRCPSLCPTVTRMSGLAGV